MGDAGAGGDGGGVLPDGNAGGGDSSPGPAPVAAVPLSACVPTTYTASVTIGASQAFELLIDTGSTSLGVASASCSSCSGVAPTYTPGTTAVDQHQQATSQFGQGSWTGEIYQDGVAPGTMPATQVRIVAIDTQSQFFVPAQCTSRLGSYQGILGLGPSASAVQGTDGYFDQLVAAQNVPNIFATRLCDRSGTLWLGGVDPAATTADPAYTPEIALFDKYYYAVNLASITVAGASAQMSTGAYTDSVVDTGTSVFILPTAVFNTITQAIAASPGFKSVFGTAGASFFSSQSNCQVVNKTKAELDATLPPLTLVFGQSPSISVQAVATESYLVPYAGAWCPALYAMDPGPNFPVASILGSPVLRSSVVVFDRANKRIGFAPHAPCP